MPADLYSNVLEDLGGLLGIRLEPDAKNTCMIRMKPGVDVFVEMDKNRERVILGGEVGEVPPGTYRERFFYEALRFNGKGFPRLGIFAYSGQSQTLVFFHSMEIEKASGAYLFALLPSFAKCLHAWREALEHGDIPEVELEGTASNSGGGGMFGLTT